MSRISQQGLERIKANILAVLYDEAPQSLSAPEIAELEVRDKEFVLRLLKDMEKKYLVRNVTLRNTKKSSWVMTEQAYKKYKELL